MIVTMERQARARELRAQKRPYDPARKTLYSVSELLEPCPGEPARTRDDVITDYYIASGGVEADVEESLNRRLHDHAIDEALNATIGRTAKGRTVWVGIMGGHGTSRRAPEYAATARCAFLVRKAGYKVMTGGGPGMMEAANLGAYMASEWGEAELAKSLELLGSGPDIPKGQGWQKDVMLVEQYRAYMARAREVLSTFVRRRPPRTPADHANLAMPTWFYGWEPTNLFADAVAKYFSNSLREDGLLSVCVGGVVYTPGSLGTVQEIFADAAQNNYETFGLTSPMVFLGRKRWTVETSVFRVITELSAGKGWNAFVALVDEPDDAVAFLRSHPPAKLG